MKKFSRTVLVFTTVMTIASCKKDNPRPFSLVGKWNEDKFILWTNFVSIGDSTKDTTVYRGTGSFIDFRTDGKVYEKTIDFSDSNYHYDTLNYSINGKSLSVTKNGETTVWTIEKMTDNSSQLYRKTTNSAATLETESWLLLYK